MPNNFIMKEIRGWRGWGWGGTSESFYKSQISFQRDPEEAALINLSPRQTKDVMRVVERDSRLKPTCAEKGCVVMTTASLMLQGEVEVKGSVTGKC